MAEALAVEMGGEVVYDPDPDSPVKQAWRTYRRALELTPAWATHRVVVQDDALLCKHFAEVLPRVVAARPDNLVVLFVPGTPPTWVNPLLHACSRDEPFALMPSTSWVPAIAVVWPARLVHAGLDFVDKQRWPQRFLEVTGADDEIIGRMRRGLNEEVWATVPSLVEHPDVHPSLMGRREARAGRDPGRVAACFMCDDCDARTIDWKA